MLKIFYSTYTLSSHLRVQITTSLENIRGPGRVLGERPPGSSAGFREQEFPVFVHGGGKQEKACV